MAYSVFNSLLYLGTLYYYYVKYKTVDAYFMLMSAFAFTAVMCMCNEYSAPHAYPNTTLLPYLYMFICLLLFLSPYRGIKIGKQLNVVYNKPVKVLTWIYILSGFIAIWYTLPDAVELIRSGEWGMLRHMLYADEDSIELYHSLPEKLTKNVHSYLEPFGIVMCFYLLSQKQKKPFIIICAFVSYLGYAFLSATLIASRGMVINFMLKLTLTFLIFKDVISPKVKRIVIICVVLLSIPLTAYIIAVSVSRFGEEGASSSAFDYLGHSMLNFNQGVMGTMHDYAFGKYFLSFVIDLIGGNSSIDLKALGYTGGTGFYTFIGDFYIDFGPIGTLLFALAVSIFLRHFTSKTRKNLSDLVFVVFFANYFMNGVFVIGKGSALSWIMCCVVYLIVRYAENYSAHMNRKIAQ